jgi:endonuclease/exonuclease/phosphatase family metal-dependent hydrolase
MYEGPREGVDQYAIYYRTARVALLRAFPYPDPESAFRQSLLFAEFRSEDFDFTLLSIHIQWDDATGELAELARVIEAELSARPEEGDLVALGDFNADCASFDENDLSHALRRPGFHWVIGNDADCDVSRATSCTRDRIILLDGTYGQEYVPGSAGVFEFDVDYGLTESAARMVSDHYPVFAVFTVNSGDDDG